MQNNLLDARIIISSKKEASWQGVLRIGNQEHPFGSEMELLLLIDKLVGGIDGYSAWASNGESTRQKDEHNRG